MALPRSRVPPLKTCPAGGLLATRPRAPRIAACRRLPTVVFPRCTTLRAILLAITLLLWVCPFNGEQVEVKYLHLRACLPRMAPFRVMLLTVYGT